MKKFLLIVSLTFFVALLGIAFPQHVNAQNCTTQGTTKICPTGGTWVVDPEVTFTGKNAARARDLLNWTLQDYRWTFTQAGKTSPLEQFWIVIRNIIYSVFILFVMATAFILIATRGKSLSAMRFIPRFFAIVLLVTFSFSMISLLYQTTDIVQGFFLRSPRVQGARCPPQCISQEDLLFIDWKYENFIGYRLVGEQYDESAFINLLLVKLTAFTYFTMVGTLFVRKIILWFFIILSPVFPLLLLYYPVRNTGKIWIGEFFRWLLYAPLFAVFLAGLVQIWRYTSNIPLNFTFPQGDAGNVVYPTATSILIGGPQMALSIQNSANNVNTFALYVVALLMLWMVILLPWVLLQIFLEYAMNYNFAENPAIKGLMGWANRPKTPPAVPPAPPAPRRPGPDLPPMKKPILPPPPPAGAGLARTIPTESTAVYKTPTSLIKPMPSYVQTLRMTNLSVPTLRDVARFETAMVSDKASQIHEISRVKDTLAKLGDPTSITSTTEQARFNEIREKLVRESQAGNIMASTIMNATNTMNVVKNSITQVSNTTSSQVVNQIKDTLSKISQPSTIQNVVERQKYQSINQKLTQASQQGDQFAKATLSSISTISTAQTPEAQKAEITKLKDKLVEEKQKGNELAKQLVTFVDNQSAPVTLPKQNNVQTVSLEDYEAVRKMWTKNYQTMDVPQNVTSGQVSRKQWIQDDISEISKTINMLSSSDPEVVDQGLQSVSTILPFLMMGGFTLPEIVAYLKAKQQAATDSLETVKSKEEEEESLVDAEGHTTAAAVKHQTMAIPTSDAAQSSGGSGAPVSAGLGADDEEDTSSMLSNITSQVVTNVSAPMNIFPSIMNAIKLTPHSAPSLKDVVKYESSIVTRNESAKTDVVKTQELLTQLADPTLILDTVKRQEVETMRQQLMKESQAGNPLATSIIQAATTIASVKNMSQQVTTHVRSALSGLLHPETVRDSVQQQQYKDASALLTTEQQKGNPFVVTTLSLMNAILATKPNTYEEQLGIASLKVKVDDEAKKNNPVAQKIAPLLTVQGTQTPLALPKDNKVQTVSLEDYEAVKKMWEENYHSMEVPQGLTNAQMTRKEWIEDDVSEITRIINLLSSSDPAMVNEGITAVSHILPFLLIGGFSMSEIIAYLKAKLEAAKAALAQLHAVENEEETKVSIAEDKTNGGDTNQSMAVQTEDEESLPNQEEPDDANRASESFFTTTDDSEDKPLKDLADEPELKELGDEPSSQNGLKELDEE